MKATLAMREKSVRFLRANAGPAIQTTSTGE